MVMAIALGPGLGSSLDPLCRVKWVSPPSAAPLAEVRVQGTSGGRTDMQDLQGEARQGQVPSTQDARDLGSMCFS